MGCLNWVELVLGCLELGGGCVGLRPKPSL